MWTHQNKDCHGCKNGVKINAIAQADREIQSLYGLRDLVMPNDVATYFDVDLEMRLNESYNTKNSWIVCWKKSIHGSIYRAKKASNKTPKFWMFCRRTQAPRFHVHHPK